MNRSTRLSIIACAAFAASTARGAQPHERAVIVASVGHDTTDISAYLPDTVKGLGPPQAWSGTPLAAAVEEKFGPAPVRLTSSVLADLSDRTKKAQRALFFDQTHISESIDDLEDVRGQLAEALWTISMNHDARALYYEVLLALARAYQTNRQLPGANKQAEARMEDVVRYFPDMPVDPKRHEQELYELYVKTRNRLPARFTVKVTIASKPPATKVCVNGFCNEEMTFRVPAGQYRFFVWSPRGEGRVHTVAVRDSDVSADVDLDFESMLRTEASTGFRFSDYRERARLEPGFVKRLALALNVPKIIVLGETLVQEQPAIGLISYDAFSKRIITSIATPGTTGVIPSVQLARLAQRVVKEERAAAGKDIRPTAEQDRAAHFVVLVGAGAANVTLPKLSMHPAQEAESEAPAAAQPIAPAPATSESRLGSHRPTYFVLLGDSPLMRKVIYASGWTMLVSAAVMMPLGLYLDFREGIGTCLSSSHLCPQTYDHSTTGEVLEGAGGAFTLGGLFYVLIGSNGEYVRDGGIGLLIAGATTVAGGAVLLYLNQFPINYGDTGGAPQPTTIGLGTEGAAIIGGGAAAMVAGSIMLIVDQTKKHRNPAVSVIPRIGRGFGGFALAGSF